jgi:hypothetical protein
MSETRDDLLTVTDSGAVFPCVVQFHNELPPQWNVHIVAIGARFFYDDGTDVQVGPTPVDIAGPNGMVPLSSPDLAKCVRQVFGAWRAVQPGHEPRNLSRMNEGQPGNCMLITHCIIKPRASVSKDQLARKDVFELESE